MSEAREAVSQEELERGLRQGGGLAAIEKQHQRGRLTARERIEGLLDPGSTFYELGLWAAWGLYAEWGGAPSAGLVCGVGKIAGRRHIIIANDATVKAGSFFPMTVKKMLRAQHVALAARLPVIYLVDSAGVFLPLQDEVFPDQDDFGRIFRNNAVISAEGIAQTAAIMGPCVAGGAYLPVMCDRILMTEGSGLYIAGPSLVKAAIGQEISSEDLGGAALHASLSGTVDFRERDDDSCLDRLRQLALARRPQDSPGDGVDAVFLKSAADSGDPVTLRTTRVRGGGMAYLALGDGLARDPARLNGILSGLRRALVVVECRLSLWSSEDTAALAVLSMQCRAAEARVLVDAASLRLETARHALRALSPALVLTPFCEDGMAAGSGLWADVLYPPGQREASLQEATALMLEGAA